MRGQRDARLNLDFHAMTEAPESQTHVVNLSGVYFGMATNHSAVAKKKRASSKGGPTEAQVNACGGGRTQAKSELCFP